MKVDRLHLIIHPGFIAESDDQMSSKGRPPIASDLMRKRYIEKLSESSKNDVALAFLHQPPGSVLSLPRNSAFGGLISDLQEMMGDRLILQSNGRLDYPFVAEEFGKAAAKAQNRGFSIDRDIPTVAYGETLQCCVSQFAENVNIAGKFDQLTTVDSHTCDRDIPGGMTTEEFMKDLPRLQKQFPHLQYNV